MEIETGEGTGGGQSSQGSYGKTALPEWQRYLLILLGEAYMVIKRASSKPKPLTQFIHGSPKNTPHHHPCLIKGHSQGGKYLTTACQHHSHCFPPASQDTELSRQGRTPLKGEAFPGPTQQARAPQAAALLSSSITGLEAWRCSKAQGIPTTLQTTTLLQAGVEEGWPTEKKKKTMS